MNIFIVGSDGSTIAIVNRDIDNRIKKCSKMSIKKLLKEFKKEQKTGRDDGSRRQKFNILDN